MGTASATATPAAPLRVCFVNLQARGAFFPQLRGKVGGAEMQVRLLAEYLAGAGCDVHLLVEDAGQPAEETALGVTLHKISQPAEGPGLAAMRRKIASALNLVKAARRVRADVYVQRAAGIETALTAHAAHAVGAAFVYMLASDSECAPPWNAGGGLAPRLFRWGLRRATGIATQHAGQSEMVKRLFAREALEIPSAFAFPTPAPGPRSGALWIGRARSLKGPQHFLELARRLPQFTFTLVALPTETEPELARELEATSRALPNVEYYPGLPAGELPALYAQRGVLVNTSDYEGMPNTFLEAAGHGLALASLRVDPGDMFAQGRAGLAAGGDLDKLTHLVRGLLTDETGCARWAERARDYLAARHELAQVGARFHELLRAVAAARGGRT
jgi:hypothetical protein